MVVKKGSGRQHCPLKVRGDNNLLTAAGRNGTVTMGFDALGRETVQTDVWGLTLTYVYDSADRMTQRQDSLNGVLTNVCQAHYTDKVGDIWR
jgi:YD repeat-containing protein